MKTILIVLLSGILFSHPCDSKKEISQNIPWHPREKDTIGTISFTSQILPILQHKCTPCHFTGGKMYERLPFDQPQTIIEHPDGILKRIKDEKENALIREFIEKNK